MKTHCLKCKKDTDNIDPKIIRTKNNRLLMQSKCSVCKNKKSFLLVGDKSMPEMHLKQPGFTYSACGPFTKNKERIDKKSKGSGIINETNYQLANELHKAIIKKFRKRKVYSSFRDNI